MSSGNKPESRPLEKQGKAVNNASDKSVGDALRAVYREAVDEDIPDELLDLLKKLD